MNESHTFILTPQKSGKITNGTLTDLAYPIVLERGTVEIYTETDAIGPRKMVRITNRSRNSIVLDMDSASALAGMLNDLAKAGKLNP